MSLRDVWRRLWSTPPRSLQPNERCPVCGADVVVETMKYKAWTMSLVRPDAELTAACVEHGRSPFNDATVRYRESPNTSHG